MAAKIHHSEQMIDIAQPETGVEVSARPGPDGATLWVNVDGVCRLRVGHFPARLLKIDLSEMKSYNLE